MKHCEKCNLEFPEFFEFCGSCGARLKDVRRCASCGELTESKWPFCVSCGSQFSERDSLPTQETEPSNRPRQEVSRDATIRYIEPGELYDADPNEETLAPRSREMAGALSSPPDRSETAEVVRNSQNVTAPSVGAVKAAPILSMMESYGRSSETPSRFGSWHRAILALIVLLFAGGASIVAWYWWSHRRPPTQAAAELPTPDKPSLTDEPSTSPTPKSSKIDTDLSADEEFQSLHDKRTKAQPSANSQLASTFAEAEKKYPNDYRFPYERAKLTIVGVASHHEAFETLALAAERAIDTGKAQQMLDSLNADEENDFYKLSRGHREWQTIKEALLNKDKTSLKALHH